VPGIVNTVHGLYASPEDPAIRRAAVYALERTASMCSGAELVQNPEDLQVLTRLRVPEDKLVLLGNGVDLQRFRPAVDHESRRTARADLGVDGDAVVVGTVARLVWQKGFRELFAAAKTIGPRHRDVVFVVVGGSDPDKADAVSPEELAAAGQSGRVIFAGDRDDMEHVYSAFDLFVLPSYREGFPRSAMEAAAAGLPVIATDIRGCREAVTPGESGLLVPVHDAARLAAAIEELVVDPGRRARMGAAGRRKAEAEFDDRTVIAKTIAAYERVLGRATSSTSRRTLRSASRPS
jgi:glycosyltransferase involved in cell wall biosynthesis